MLTILFVIFFILWAVSMIPGVDSRIGGGSGWFAWICVGLLALHIGEFSALHG